MPCERLSAAGIRDFGREQSLAVLVKPFGSRLLTLPDLNWHLIGLLQNKAKKALELFQ